MDYSQILHDYRGDCFYLPAIVLWPARNIEVQRSRAPRTLGYLQCQKRSSRTGEFFIYQNKKILEPTHTEKVAGLYLSAVLSYKETRKKVLK